MPFEKFQDAAMLALVEISSNLSISDSPCIPAFQLNPTYGSGVGVKI